MCAVTADAPRDKPVPIRPDWLSKTLAGLLLGLAFALAASALFSDMAADMPLAVRGQLAMWMLPPIWLGIFSGVYFFTSGLRAWLWLGGANALAYGALAAIRLGA